LFTSGFLQALKARVQKTCVDRFANAQKVASYNNSSVDENNQALLVSEKNMNNVMCLLGEAQWPVRTPKELRPSFRNKLQLLETMGKESEVVN
jgi:hypothetical protein